MTGNVKNYNSPSVFNVGYIGYGKYKASLNGLDTREYSLWHGMLERCYSKYYLKTRPSYLGCSVDERWHNFQKFCEDLPYLQGYEKWKSPENKMQLDKDIKIKNNKFYSRDTYIFATISENTLDMLNRRYENDFVLAVSPNNETYVIKSVVKFSKDFNLQASKISSCIHGERKHHKNWKFFKIDNKRESVIDG